MCRLKSFRLVAYLVKEIKVYKKVKYYTYCNKVLYLKEFPELKA